MEIAFIKTKSGTDLYLCKYLPATDTKPSRVKFNRISPDFKPIDKWQTIPFNYVTVSLPEMVAIHLGGEFIRMNQVINKLNESVK